MKKILLAGAALCVLSSAATAADPVLFEEVVVAPPPAQVWDGLFVGVIGGYGWAQSDLKAKSWAYHDMDINFAQFDDVFLSDDDYAHSDDKGNGWFGGGLVGYNFQSGNFVFGVEGDINASDISLGSTSTSSLAAVSFDPPCGDPEPCPDPAADDDDDALVAAIPPVLVPYPLEGSTHAMTTAHADVDWYGTARLKAGYAHNNILAYVTGGLAYGKVNLNGHVDATHSFGNGVEVSQTDSFSDSSRKVGWTLGAGLDVALSPSVIVGGFYRYVDLGEVSAGTELDASATYGTEQPFALVNESGTASGSASSDANFHTLGIRAAFKFNSGS